MGYGQDIYENPYEDLIIYTGDNDRSVYIHPMFLLYNKNEEYLLVGYCSLGWACPLDFTIYIVKYFDDLYGKEIANQKFSELYLKTSNEKAVVFAAPNWYTVTLNELIPEKSSDLYIEEWLKEGFVFKNKQQMIFKEEIDRIAAILSL